MQPAFLALMLLAGDDTDARAALALAAAERERPTQFIPRAIPAPPPAAVLSFGSGWSVASSFTAGAPVWCGPAG